MPYQLPAARDFPSCEGVIEAVSPLAQRELREGLNTGRAGLLRYGMFEEFVEGLSFVAGGPDQLVDGITDVTRLFRSHRARRKRDESDMLSKPKSPGNISKETCVAGAYFERQLFLAILQNQIPKALALYDALVERGVRIYPADLPGEVEVYRDVVQNGGVGSLQVHFDQLAEVHAETFKKEVIAKKIAEGTLDPAKIRNNAASRKTDAKKAYLVSLTRAQASHLLEVRQQLRGIWLATEGAPNAQEKTNNPPTCVMDDDEEENGDEIVHEDVDENEQLPTRSRAESRMYVGDDEDDVEESESEYDPGEPDADEHGEDGSVMRPATRLSSSDVPLDDDIHGENASSCSTFGRVGNTQPPLRVPFETSPVTIEGTSFPRKKAGAAPVAALAIHDSNVTPLSISESSRRDVSSDQSKAHDDLSDVSLVGAAQPVLLLFGALSLAYLFAGFMLGWPSSSVLVSDLSEHFSVDL